MNFSRYRTLTECLGNYILFIREFELGTYIYLFQPSNLYRLLSPEGIFFYSDSTQDIDKFLMATNDVCNMIMLLFSSKLLIYHVLTHSQIKYLNFSRTSLRVIPILAQPSSV